MTSLFVSAGPIFQDTDAINMTVRPYDIRNWGGVIGTDPDHAALNDIAFTNAINSDTAVIDLPGPVVVSKKILFDERPITIRGTNPFAAGAGEATNVGGLLVTGTDTAQSDALLEFKNTPHVSVENVRFFGHLDAPTTKINTAIKFNSQDPANDANSASGMRINGCVFRHLNFDGTKTWTDVIQVIDTGATDQQSDEWTISQCELHGFTRYGVYIENTQSVATSVRDTTINGAGDQYEDFADVGILLRGSATVDNVFFNRCQKCVDINQSQSLWMRGCHIENTRTIVWTSGATGQRVSVSDCVIALQTTAFRIAGAHDSSTHATVLTDSSASFVTNEFSGQTIENATDGSSGTVTSNTATTITCSGGLSGGTDNQWENGDWYEIFIPTQPIFRCRCEHFGLQNCDIVDALDAAIPKPHLRIGPWNETTQKSTIAIIDCGYIKLSDIQTSSAKGLPSQVGARLDANGSDDGVLFEFKSSFDRVHIRKQIPSGMFNVDDIYGNGTGNLNPGTIMEIDSSAGALTGTLPDDWVVGRRTRIIMTDATNVSTVSVTNHVTSDPEVFTFDAVGEYLELEWMGTEYRTVDATATV